MKKLLTILFILIAYVSYGQYAPMTAYGYKYKRIMADSTLHIPNFCGVPTLQDTTTKKAAIAFDSCNNRLYFYNPKTFTWGYFSGSGFDTTTIYETINNILTYIYDTSFTNQFMPAGILLDTTYFVDGTADSVRAYVYTDSTVVYDTMGTSLISSITNNITNIFDILDSARSDTSVYISTILNGDTLLKVRHNPNNRNDTIYFTLVASNPTRDGYMPKEAWALFNNGQDGKISGGRVTWLTNYTYNVSEAYYRIDSVIYHSPSTDITLDAAHATDDRIDLFLLTTSNTAVKLTGTAGSGIPPDFDASLYLEASFALVTANTTQPPNIVQQWIYRENLGTAGGEFDNVASSVRINVNSTNNPDLGTKTIEGTLTQNNDYFDATSGAGFTITPYNVLSFRIRSKSNWGNNKKLVIRPKSAPSTFTGNNVVIGSGSYGFASNQTTTYQTITIPLSDFGIMTNPNAFRFTQSNTSGTSGWYIDNIQLQNITTSGTVNDVYDLVKNATGDSFHFSRNGTIIRRLKDSVGSAGGSGGISEVVAGYGLTNVNDSTLEADTTHAISTKAWRQKGIDSVQTNINLKVNISDTAAMLSPYLKKLNITAGTNVTLTGSGTDGSPYVIGASGGGITGSGTYGRVTYWDGTSSVTSDTAFRAQPLGTLTSTKTYSGVAIKPTPTATANTDTLVGLEITNKWNPLSFTGVKHYGIKINKTFIEADSLYNIIIGRGNGASTSLGWSNFIGYDAGVGATGAYISNFLGHSAGNGATGASSSNFMGYLAGSGATGASNSNFLGQQAGSGATNANNSNFFGPSAGLSATNATQSNFLGSSAGNLATNASNSNFFGSSAGGAATSADNSNFFGAAAGSSATSANNSNFFGAAAGATATNANRSNFLGYEAGRYATNASTSNFIGYQTGLAATGASYSNFLGYRVGDSLTHKITGSNNIIIGTNITTPTAGTANTFNIGNVLYGTNTYSTTGGNPATAAQTTGQVGINVTTPNASAALQIDNTTMGFLPPRMTATQASAIASPAEGLLVYVTDTNGTFTAKGWWGWEGAAWVKLNN